MGSRVWEQVGRHMWAPRGDEGGRADVIEVWVDRRACYIWTVRDEGARVVGNGATDFLEEAMHEAEVALDG